MTLTSLFLAAIIANTLVQWWLMQRQRSHVAAHRGAVPAEFADSVTLPEHQKAADYVLAKSVPARVEILAGAVLVLAWTLGGGLDLLDGAWRSLGTGPVLTGTGVIVSLFLIMGAIEMPMRWWITFGVEARFGFNKTTPALFVVDTLKQAALLLAIGVPLAMLVLWLMERSGQLWWFYVWLVLVCFSLLMIWVYPVFIAPLFNRFEPLADKELERRIHGLLERLGFTSKGIFVMDGSKRSGHGNAYFTGFGNNKRIVFFDTLLEDLDADEVEAVLAHELGHFKHRHILKGMLISFVYTLAGLALLGWFIDKDWFYSALGVQQASIYMALLLFLIAGPVFTFFLGPLFARLSRYHEFQADDFAAREAGAGTLITALVKMYRENASTLTPDPLYSAFHDSHPPAPVRIAHLEQGRRA